MVAAGRGSRFGGEKLLADLAGRPVIEWALDNVCHAATSDHLVIVCSDAVRSAVTSALVRLGRVADIVAGGETRQQSVENALPAVGGAGTVVIHDAARPLCPPEVMQRVEAAARAGHAVTAALPVVDSIKQVDGARVVASLDRRQLVAVQTPQGFPRLLLVDAHRAARAAGVVADDDCALVERLGAEVQVVAGSPLAHKLTGVHDLWLLEALARSGGLQ